MDPLEVNTFVKKVAYISPGKKMILETNRHCFSYLKVCELRMIKVGVDMESGSDDKEQLEFVERGANISGESQTPDLQEGFQVKQGSKSHLKEQRP